RWELEEGEVIEMPSPGEMHALVCWFVIRVLTEYVLHRGSGHILTNDCGLIVRRKPDTVRGPDVMLSLDNLTLEEANPGHSQRIPTLVVEVFSPSDRPGRLYKRVEQYFRRGVPLVWVLYPEERTANVFRKGELPKVLDETETLSGNGILPGFTCKVRDLFELPGQAAKPARPRPRKGSRD
ncbi:MAG TPA: Uma2 family endonuclease, partial [Gemmataceae bacterium]